MPHLCGVAQTHDEQQRVAPPALFPIDFRPLVHGIRHRRVLLKVQGKPTELMCDLTSANSSGYLSSRGHCILMAAKIGIPPDQEAPLNLIAEDVMAWIKVIAEGEAQGELKRYYEEMREPNGEVDNILKIHSLNPPSLRAHYDLYKLVMYGRSELSRKEREMVALVASSANRCHY
jgi:hypothetical protein